MFQTFFRSSVFNVNVIGISLQVFGYLIVLLSVIPLIRKDYWTFRVFEYPRLQKLFLTVLILCLYVFLVRDKEKVADYVFIAILLANSGYLLYLVYPFTVFSPRTVISSADEADQTVSILISNVYQHNKNARGCMQLYKKYDPDVILLVEINGWWVEQLKDLEKEYPFRLLFPLPNTYGIGLYSKLKLEDEQIKFLAERDIPSVHTMITLRSGRQIRLYGLHPMPPVPNENPRSTERDKEILLVAEEVRHMRLPVIVAGDLNDVAWSYTTELFLKISGLLDPRIGRGFFNTFHARYPLMRFPLDHVFCSHDFSLIEMKRLPNCGSDHFPMFVRLKYDPEARVEQDEAQADADEKEMAAEKIKKPT